MATAGDMDRRLRDAVRCLVVAHRVLTDLKRPCGASMSITHAYALLELYGAARSMTISELTDRLVIDRTNVSRLCARMEQAGEVARSVHPEDGRARVLQLTAHGRRLARGVDESSARHFAALVTKLGSATGRVIESLELLQQAITTKEEDE